MPDQSQSSSFVKCPGCGARLSVRAESAGKKGQCHECGKVFRIGAAPAAKSGANEGDAGAAARREPRPPEPPKAAPWAIDNDHLHPLFCEVCQTLMYATDDQVGKMLPCPDCGHRNLAKPREKKKQPKNVMVADGDEYQLDESSAPPPTPRLTPIEDREAQGRAAAIARLQKTVPKTDQKVDESPASAEPEQPSRGKRRRPVRDPRRPLVPVIQGVMRMLVTGEASARWVALSVGLTAILFLILQVLGAMGNQALFVLPLFAGGCMLAGVWLMSAAPFFVAIITESSDGNDELYDPPNWLSFDVAEAGFLLIAVAISAFPAWLATKAAVALPMEERLAIGGSVWMLIFPFVVLSALEQGSAFAIVSPRLATSLVRCFVPWATFYVASMALVAGAAKLAEYLFTRGTLAALLPIPWIIVALIIIYMRMLGRLGWWIADAMPAPSKAEGD